MLKATEFEWDDDKASHNLEKHRIAFEVATAVFVDPDRIFINAARNADEEERWKVVGIIDDRLFTVVFTMRDGICRLISARRSNIKEERTYGTHAV